MSARIAVLTFAMLTATAVCAQSVLQSGMWYKVGVSERGVYKITGDQLQKMGFNAVDPAQIHIYGNAGGMLPQPNNAPRPQDLQEIAIAVFAGTDNRFDKNDYLLFFAEGPDNVRYIIDKGTFYYESNLYSDNNYYFITVSPDAGKRIEETPAVTGPYPVIDTYNDFIYHESDDHNELQSGREWFGERYDLSTTYAYRYEIEGIVENSPMTWVSDVMAQSFNGSSFKLSFNHVPVAEQTVSPINNTQYGIKGRHQRDTIPFAAGTVNAAGSKTQEIRYEYIKSASGKNVGFLDFMLISFERRLALYGDQTIFRAGRSLEAPGAKYEVSKAGNLTAIWDITDSRQPRQQVLQREGETTTFTADASLLREFVAIGSHTDSPELVGAVPNQNLRGPRTPDMIIVAHPLFLSEAERLAAHRRAHNSWSVDVVTPSQIYNEFSSGRQDVTAIRDFVKFVNDKDPGHLKALLLMGKGSYDYKDRMPNNTNFVPTYESRNSLSPLETYSSDDYFAFLEDHEGNWGESPVQHHTLDVGVGRLPVKTAEEARHVVDKIIAYDISKKNFGYWRKEIVFIADDGSNSDGFSSIHQSQANAMAESIESLQPAFDTRKVFLGTYDKTATAAGEVIPAVNKVIRERFRKGTLIINYTGHGNERLLTDERVFATEDINELNNVLYPFMVTATCEFGRHDDPAVFSGAEQAMLRANGGAIGLVTSARPVNSPTNFLLNQQFYTSLFTRDDHQHRTLGAVFRETKNNSTSGVGNRNFSLLGDPSLTLAMPLEHVVATSVTTASGSDTLKALSTVTIRGEIRDLADGVITDFQGIVEVTLHDKTRERVTIGKNDPPYSYRERSNALFRGKATVTNGIFECAFIMPRNMDLAYGQGKLGLYAYNPATGKDASGVLLPVIGGQDEPGSDITGPSLSAFMGDTTFVNGGVVAPNTMLVVLLEDASGINISTHGDSGSLTAVLDGGDTFDLSDYYQASTDDYTRGWVNFPMTEMAPGQHTITVTAFDTHNNRSETIVNFIVSDGEALVIETFANYPNPFTEDTQVFFTHNRPGDDLEVIFALYTSTGRELGTLSVSVSSSTYQVDILKIDNLSDFGKKLTGGVYLARVAVRSLTNGSKSERVTKLIVAN